MVDYIQDKCLDLMQCFALITSADAIILKGNNNERKHLVKKFRTISRGH